MGKESPAIGSLGMGPLGVESLEIEKPVMGSLGMGSLVKEPLGIGWLGMEFLGKYHWMPC